VRVENTLSPHHPISNGVPQGSVISVYCFLLLINDVINFIPAPIQARLFADYLNISLTTSNLKYATNILQICLSNLQEWSKTSGLKFSETKTKRVIFSRKHSQPTISLRLNNILLKIFDEATFLGLKFDHKLSWKPHILDLKKRVLLSTNLLKMLRNRTFGPTAATLIKTYKTLIRSKIDYDCIVYNSASTHVLSQLDPIQNSCLQIVLRAFPTSPTLNLQALTGIPPLAVRRKMMSTNYALNVLSKRIHTCNIATHLKLLQTVAIGDPPAIPTRKNGEQIHLTKLPRKIIPLLPVSFLQHPDIVDNPSPLDFDALV